VALLGALWLSACVSSGGQSGTEALDVREKDAATDSPTSPPTTDDTESDVSTDPGTTVDGGSTPNDTEPLQLPEGSFKFYVDYYPQPCSAGERSYCLRGSLTQGEYVVDESIEWTGFQWGHRYEVVAHNEPTGQQDGGVSEKIVVDQILNDEIPAGDSFTLSIDPTLDTLGYASHLNYDLPTGASTFVTGPNINCELALCGALSEALSKNARFDATFELDANAQFSLVELNVEQENTSELVTYLRSMAEDWETEQPEQYVFSTCGFGFVPPECRLVAIDKGSVVAAEDQSVAGEWTEVTLETNPIWEMFSAAENAVEIEVSPVGYVSSYTQRSISESWGKEVRCFVADTLDIEACRDAM
jgi:hypothetical protein